jgi:hypothetical protein
MLFEGIEGASTRSMKCAQGIDGVCTPVHVE